MNPMHWLANLTNLSPQRTRQLIFIVIGLALVIFGILYAIGPVIVGTVMGLLGWWVLLKNSIIARRLYVRGKRRFPGVFYSFEKWRRRRRKVRVATAVAKGMPGRSDPGRGPAPGRSPAPSRPAASDGAAAPGRSTPFDGAAASGGAGGADAAPARPSFAPED